MARDFEDLASGIAPFADLKHPRDLVRQFTPNWFALVMGTGVVAIALDRLPGSWPPLTSAAYGLWLASVALLGLATSLYCARWLFFFREAKRVFGHSTVSMALGTIPMALATVLNGAILFGPGHLGTDLTRLVVWLWWFDVVLAVLCAVTVPYLMFTRQQHSVDQMTGVWLLPVVAAEVAAVTGGLLLPHLPASEQPAVLVTSLVLWGISMPLAFSILAILILRMALHNLPPRDAAASSWLTLGPLGTGALALLTLGETAAPVLASQGLDAGPASLRLASALCALVIWGYGLWWLSMALVITTRYARKRVPFNLGWWGYVFPLGVFALATLKLGDALSLRVFISSGSFLVACLCIVWLLVAARTAIGIWRGNLFVAPCLIDPVR